MIRIINVEDIALRKDYKDERKREFIISNERRDAHGTVIRMDGWKIDDFNRSGAFYYQHLTGSWEDPNPDNALGPASAYRDGSTLVGIANFEPGEINPLAAKILGKVDYGTLINTSVGFVPLRGHWGVEKLNEDPETYYFDEQILKEFSIVHIPSNPDAIKKSMESYDKYMAAVSEFHASEGFKRDFKRELSRIKRRREYLLNLCNKRNIL